MQKAPPEFVLTRHRCARDCTTAAGGIVSAWGRLSRTHASIWIGACAIPAQIRCCRYASRRRPRRTSSTDVTVSASSAQSTRDICAGKKRGPSRPREDREVDECV